MKHTKSKLFHNNNLYKLIAILLSAHSSSALASGFLLTQAGADLGFLYAGAAVSNNAQVQFYNPAGLSLIHRQELSMSALGIFPELKFSGTSITPNRSIETGVAKNTEFGYVTNSSYAVCLNDAISIGFNIAPVFGLGLRYPDNSVIRYDLTRVKLITVDYSPAISVRFNRSFSVGFALDVIRNGVKIHAKAQTSPDPSISLPDGESEGHGYATNLGWHAGLLYEPTCRTRYGLAYHSRIVEDLTGKSVLDTFEGSLHSPNFKLDNHLPPYTIFSFQHDFNDCWGVLGSVDYEQWSVLDKTQFKNIADEPGVRDDVVNYKDTWFVALGAKYQPCPKFYYRAGISYASSPIPDPEHVDLTIASGDSLGLAAGFHYQITPKIGTDLAYAHVFIRSTSVNHISGVSDNHEIGTYSSNANVISGQLTWCLG